MKLSKSLNFFVLLAPLVVTLFQAVYTFSSFHFIRGEELGESIRNVYWFRQGLLYNYLSHNFGWYATMDLANRVLGYGLNTAKYLRLILYFLSMLCLSWLTLRIFTTWKRALVVFLGYALSPTVLYLNTLQAQYGLDLIYLPILIFLALDSWTGSKWKQRLVSMLLGVMIAMSFFTYAIFYFSLPFVLFLFGYMGYAKAKQGKIDLRRVMAGNALMLLVGIGITGFLFRDFLVRNRMLAFYSYLLQTGGQTFAYVPTFKGLAENLRHLARDLFVTGSSYNFELTRPDFSGLFFWPTLGLAVVMIYLKRRQLTTLWPIVWTILLTAGYNLYVIQYKNAPITDSGIRRSTPVFLSIYFIWGLGWYLASCPRMKRSFKNAVIVGGLMLMPLHHLWVYVANLESIRAPSQFSFNYWFKNPEEPAQKPAEVLKQAIEDLTKEPRQIKCAEPPQEGRYDVCRYPEFFAALKLGCDYENLPCKPVYGYDYETGEYIEIQAALWDTEYWPM